VWKLGENLWSIEQSEIFGDFVDSEGSKANETGPGENAREFSHGLESGDPAFQLRRRRGLLVQREIQIYPFRIETFN
jgi:hypothetical protein